MTSSCAARAKPDSDADPHQRALHRIFVEAIHSSHRRMPQKCRCYGYLPVQIEVAASRFLTSGFSLRFKLLSSQVAIIATIGHDQICHGRHVITTTSCDICRDRYVGSLHDVLWIAGGRLPPRLCDSRAADLLPLGKRGDACHARPHTIRSFTCGSFAFGFRPFRSCPLAPCDGARRGAGSPWCVIRHWQMARQAAGRGACRSPGRAE